jgi:hypothetical protein
MLLHPVLLASPLVVFIIRIFSHLIPLPSGTPGPLAALIATISLAFNPGLKFFSAMDTFLHHGPSITPILYKTKL